jgi:hypothetical protein
MMRLLVLLILTSCAYQSRVYPKLFPYGTYQHEVTITADKKSMTFPGVNLWTPDDLTVVALGAFDTTLLKYKETFANGKKEIFVDRNFIPLSDEKAKMYLSIIRKLYELDRSICERKTCRKSIYGQEFIFDLNEAEDVSSIRVLRDETKITIKVVGYEKLS